MGASGWDYFVPYHPDIGRSLQELRQMVFEQGAYYKPAEFYERILDIQPESLQALLRDKIETRYSSAAFLAIRKRHRPA